MEPPDLPDEKIISALREDFLVPVLNVTFLPLGLDSYAWTYRVNAADRVYFLKIKKEIQNPSGILIPGRLKELGLEQVIVPLSTRTGTSWLAVDEFYFILYPFIRGRQVMEVGMSDDHWVEFGSILRQLHTTRLPQTALREIRRETFIPKRLDWDRQMHPQIKARIFEDPFQRELAAFWLDHYSTISTILQRTNLLADKMKTVDREFVLCHADIHTANLLLTEEDKIFLVDWDETMLAPKERDLMFVVGGTRGKEEENFFRGYGDTEIDPLALAYYRYDWCVEDIGEFADLIFELRNIGDQTKMDSIQWFKRMFAPGSSVQTALGTPIEV